MRGTSGRAPDDISARPNALDPVLSRSTNKLHTEVGLRRTHSPVPEDLLSRLRPVNPHSSSKVSDEQGREVECHTVRVLTQSAPIAHGSPLC